MFGRFTHSSVAEHMTELGLLFPKKKENEYYDHDGENVVLMMGACYTCVGRRAWEISRITFAYGRTRVRACIFLRSVQSTTNPFQNSGIL